MTRRHHPKGTPEGGQFAPGAAASSGRFSKAAATNAVQAERTARRAALEAQREFFDVGERDAESSSGDVGDGPHIEITETESQLLREELDRYLQERYALSGLPSERQRARAEKHLAKLHHKIAARDAN
ncbi:hypothetical protein [Candidatus Poriferisodalis sp.]|uniref:hypothetical protein n=1 Tax=Candidatus Poriferisodalis sp. TaxID=3101277 RepID=UPI003B01A58A